MTNEEKAVNIQQGRRECILPLWEGVQRFVYREAGRWARAWQGRGGVELEDLIQAGFLAMLEAVEDYDPAKGAFLTWYALFLKTAFSEAVGCRTQGQRREPLNAALSLDAPTGEEDEFTLGDTLEGPDLIADADRRLYLEQLHSTLEAELEQLPAEQRAVLERRFYGEQTRKQIAEAEGLTLYNVQALEQHGLNALRRPQVARKLRQYLDERTDFYGLHGVHSVEGAVVHREWVEAGFSEP